MAKELYTIVLHGGPKQRARVTAPAVPGFEFTAASRMQAFLEAPKRLEAHLRKVAKDGKRIPREPGGFFLDWSIVRIRVPNRRKAPAR